jgi:hypothetical protein
VGCVQDQRCAAEIEKPFVAAHARASAPGKNEPSDLGVALHACCQVKAFADRFERLQSPLRGYFCPPEGTPGFGKLSR